MSASTTVTSPTNTPTPASQQREQKALRKIRVHNSSGRERTTSLFIGDFQTEKIIKSAGVTSPTKSSSNTIPFSSSQGSSSSMSPPTSPTTAGIIPSTGGSEFPFLQQHFSSHLLSQQPTPASPAAATTTTTTTTTPSKLTIQTSNEEIRGSGMKRVASSPCMGPFELTVAGTLPRCKYNTLGSTLLLNLSGLHIRTSEDVNTLTFCIEKTLEKPKQQLEKKMGPGTKVGQFVTSCFVNYDDFTIDDDVIEEFSEMAKYLTETYYQTVHRFTMTSFKDSLRKLEAKLKVKRVDSAEIQPAKVIGDKYVVVMQVGQGSFATVWKGNNKLTGDIVAIKCITKDKINKMQLQPFIDREVAILKAANHRNIVKFIDYVDTETHVYIVQEWVTKANLGISEDERVGLPELTAKALFLQLLDAFGYLQDSLHVAHRDVQISNLCLDDEGNVKVIDFGCADYYTPGQATHTLLTGSILYTPREVLTQQPYIGPEVDIWALGVVLFKLLTGVLPFESSQKILLHQFYCDINHETHLSADCIDLVMRILQPNPSLRPTIAQIRQHPWLLP